jgi:hypothetical protein
MEMPSAAVGNRRKWLMDAQEQPQEMLSAAVDNRREQLPQTTGANEASPWLRTIWNLVNQNALARQRGARSAAQRMAPNDPSMAAYGGLAGMLEGQSDASNQMSQATNAWLGQQDSQQWQERMLRLRAQLEEEAMKRANAGGIWGDVGGLAGNVAGAWLTGGLV